MNQSKLRNYSIPWLVFNNFSEISHFFEVPELSSQNSTFIVKRPTSLADGLDPPLIMANGSLLLLRMVRPPNYIKQRIQKDN